MTKEWNRICRKSRANAKAPKLRVALSEPLTASENEYVNKLIRDIGGLRKFRVRQCWRNAQRLIFADVDKRLRYWECGLPVPHAWVTINGKVVDVTHNAALRKLKRMGLTPSTSGHQYRGAVVNRSTVFWHFMRTFGFSRVLAESGGGTNDDSTG